jgi:hypothetical protein
LVGSSAFAGESDLIVRSAVIANRKPSGEGWDAFNGPPDPVVKVAVCNESGVPLGHVRTEAVQDTYRPSFSGSSLLRVREGDQLIIQVWDEDVLADDPIGEIKVTVTKRMLDDGSYLWSFDSVQDLRIDFRPTN